MTIQKGVSEIGVSAFSGCDSLTSVTLPNSVKRIEGFAFRGCDSLTSVTIPNSVTVIGEYTFSDCVSLTSVTIPNSVTVIGEYTFSDCVSLTSVTIPNSVTRIDDSAFSCCNSLTSVTIPNSVTEIGDHAFSECTSLTNVTIPNSVTVIRDYAFALCLSLTGVTIPNIVTEIGYGAFWNCTNLTSVTIPKSVMVIGEGAFDDCESLTDVYYGGTQADWGKISFAPDNDTLSEANIHFTVQALTVSSVKANKTSALTGESIKWTATASGGTGDLQYCFYIYRDGTQVKKIAYSSSKSFSYSPTEPGSYTVKCFVKDGDGTVKNKTSAAVTVERGVQALTVSSVKANKSSALTGESIKWTATAAGGTGAYQYCFYLYRDGTQVKKVAYNASNTFSYSPTAPGSYTVKCFVKDGDGTVKSKSGTAVTVTG